MGKFQKGQPRPLNAGRKPGSINKKTLALLDKCEARGIDLFDRLLDLCESEDKQLALAATKEALQYIHPKKRAVEMKVDGDVQHAATDEIKGLFETWIRLAKGERTGK